MCASSVLFYNVKWKFGIIVERVLFRYYRRDCVLVLYCIEMICMDNMLFSSYKWDTFCANSLLLVVVVVVVFS